MNKIWHDKGKPNFGALVVIINSEHKITFFGYYSFRAIDQDEKWAYMVELVDNTI